MKVEINKTDEHTILYDRERKLFCLNDAAGNEIATARTEDQIEAEIKKVINQAFKLPIPALKSTYTGIYQGRITSVNLDLGKAFFAYDDKKYGRTEKITLRYDHNCFELTTANKAIASKVAELNVNIKVLRDEIEALKDSLENPINDEYFNERERG